MKRIYTALMLLSLVASAKPIQEKQFYVDLPFQDREDMRSLTESGKDVVGVDYERNVVTILMRESELQKIKKQRILGKRSVVSPDLSYKKPADIEKILIETESKFPTLAQVRVIGKSVEKRNIYAIHLTNQSVVKNKTAIVFDALHHAREIMTPEIALDIIDYLTKNYATDPKVKNWMDNYDIWVVPMVNPDGNQKVWTSQSMWRKNTQSGYGVDINRNYPYAWNTCNGSSGSKSSETYRGDKPASEPESNALMDLMKQVRPMFNISYHSTSEIVIFPFGCNPKRIPQPDRDVYEGVGRELAKRLIRDSGSGSYTPGTSYQLLYNVDGGSIDWMYDYDKIMAFVVEVNSSSQGFQPSFKRWRDSTVERQRPGWMYILERMSQPGIKP